MTAFTSENHKRGSLALINGMRKKYFFKKTTSCRLNFCLVSVQEISHPQSSFRHLKENSDRKPFQKRLPSLDKGQKINSPALGSMKYEPLQNIFI
ncbi:hypothetical protein CEXT_635811 [Caerostris extrusa]|uniref:Uncharacterized protein n=1 Tax=Caerostris extrusa TaxID=172846 RepID=A0AAV4MGW3_CAEEX|nr:hypothetical protein CEXT_635811 [Caerostris extrusa]